MVLAYLRCFVECGPGWPGFLRCFLWFRTDFGCLSPCLCGVLGEVKLLWSFELALALAIQPLGFCVLVCVETDSGACTLDVSLRLVCSGLKLVRRFFQVNLFLLWTEVPWVFLGQSDHSGWVVVLVADG